MKHCDIHIDGTSVTYHDSETSISERPPLVLVHGTSGSTQSHFGYLFPMLATSQRVISIDLANPAADELTLAQLVRQVEAVITHAVPGKQVSLLGYSLGAVVAAAVSARHPALIKNLILVAGWLKSDTHQKLRNNIWTRLRADGNTVINDYMTFCALSSQFLASKSLEEVAAVAAMIQIDDFTDQQMRLNYQIDISAEVAAITATTLVVGCTYDQMVPKHHSKQLFGAIQDARYAEIASGHGVVFERPAELLQLVNNFTKSPSTYQTGAHIPALRP